MDINFEVGHEDAEIIGRIAARGMDMARKVTGRRLGRDKLSYVMDITATHANGNPLRLGALLNADDANFSHDFFGIIRHLDRETGQLGGCFVPRFSVPQS